MTRVPAPSADACAAAIARAGQADARLAALRDLLEAIRDAVRAPRPASYAGREAFRDLQRDRAIAAHGAAEWTLEHWDRPGSAGIAAGTLRDRIQEPDYEIRKDVTP